MTMIVFHYLLLKTPRCFFFETIMMVSLHTVIKLQVEPKEEAKIVSIYTSVYILYYIYFLGGGISWYFHFREFSPFSKFDVLVTTTKIEKQNTKTTTS
jgi:hypothetical protein